MVHEFQDSAKFVADTDLPVSAQVIGWFIVICAVIPIPIFIFLVSNVILYYCLINLNIFYKLINDYLIIYYHLMLHIGCQLNNPNF